MAEPSELNHINVTNKKFISRQSNPPNPQNHTPYVWGENHNENILYEISIFNNNNYSINNNKTLASINTSSWKNTSLDNHNDN